MLHVSKRSVKTPFNFILVFIFAECTSHHFLQTGRSLQRPKRTVGFVSRVQQWSSIVSFCWSLKCRSCCDDGLVRFSGRVQAAVGTSIVFASWCRWTWLRIRQFLSRLFGNIILDFLLSSHARTLTWAQS